MMMSLKSVPAARLAFVGLVVALLTACGQESPETLMASAKAYLAKGDRSAAVIQLKNLLKGAPNNGEARLLLGQALLEEEDFASAEKELSRALELKQPQEKVLPSYVRSLLAQEKNHAVVAEVEKYKLFDPAAVAATQAVLGDAHMRLGSRTRARDAYVAALAAVPGHARAQLGEARLLAYEGRTDDALMRIDAVIAAEPKLAEARATRAEVLLAKGDREGAKMSLEEAIAANARFMAARITLINLLIHERDFDAAAKSLEGARKVAPRDLRLTFLEASLAFRKGELEKARQQIEQVLRGNPDHLPSLVLAGAIELQAKRFGAAEDSLRKALARAPNHLDARQLLVQTYLRTGQPAKAMETLQPIVDRGIPDDPRLQMLAGETFLANGDVQRATTFYQAAAKGKQEQEIAARTRLGQIALATGRSQEGFAELEAVSALDAEGYDADLALITGHLRRKEFDRAMEAVKALETKQPKNPLTFQLYGVVSLGKGDQDAARRSFEKALELQPTYLPAAHNLAQLDILQKKPESARQRYEAMIAKEPNNAQLYIALADLQARTGAAPKEISVTLQRAVQADPQAPLARVGLIDMLLRAGDTKAALTAAQQALASIPSDPRLLEAAGIAQEAAGEINQAIGTYNKLASAQPQAAQPLYRLAALYLRQNDTEKAIESLRRVQKIAPQDHEVVAQAVRVYAAAGRYGDALKEAQALQKRQPKFAGGYSLEGDIHMAQRKFADAERLYREALKLEPRANAVAVKLHEAMSAGGNGAGADAWGKKWIAENPKDATMRLYLGQRELAAKNLKAAAAHYQAAIAIEPNAPIALNNLAWISGELNDPKALGYAERAMKAAPNSAVILDTYGMLLVKRGEADKALPYLERASKLAPARNDLRLNYAKALVRAGKQDEARKELEALQGVKDDFPGKEEVAGLLKGL